MRHFKSLILVVLIFSICSTSFAQLQKTQAAFIYNFAFFMYWPSEYQNGNFNISVLGNSDIIKELEMMTNEKKVGDQVIKVNKVNSLKDLGNPHILFIPDDQHFRLKDAIKATENTSTLVVTETPGSNQKGASINFIFVSNKLKFEINEAIADKKKIVLPEKLLKLGVQASNN